MTTYIYALYHPTTGEIRYIGKSRNPKSRYNDHIHSARANVYDHHAARWIRAVLSEGSKPAMRILNAVPEEMDWAAQERFFIASGLHLGLRLTNGTRGGDGGALLTEDARKARARKVKEVLSCPEVREKISTRVSESYDRPGRRERRSEVAKTLWQNEEYAKRVVEKLAETNSRPEVREKRRKVSKETVNRPEVKAKLAQRTRDWLRTPEGKAHRSRVDSDPVRNAKIAEHSSKLWVDPEYRAKMEAALNNPEVVAKAKERSKAQWADPVKRERIVAGIRAAAARRKAERLAAQPQAPL